MHQDLVEADPEQHSKAICTPVKGVMKSDAEQAQDLHTLFAHGVKVRPQQARVCFHLFVLECVHFAVVHPMHNCVSSILLLYYYHV